MDRQPPALAVWLLKRFGLTARNEPLAGDLLEEFRSGRTAAWYWRQVFMAIVAEFGQRLRFCRLDLLSLFVGWVAETFVLLVWWILHAPFGFYGFVLAVATLAAVWMAMYVEYRIRLNAWRKDFDSSEEESDEILGRRISPRFMALVVFGTAIGFDGVTMLVTRLPWPELAHLSLLPTVLILNIVMLFTFAGLLVLRSRPDSSRGDTDDEKPRGFWRREISRLGPTAFLFAFAVLCHSDPTARSPWLELVCWSTVAFSVVLDIFRFLAFAVARILPSHPDLSVTARPPGGDV